MNGIIFLGPLVEVRPLLIPNIRVGIVEILVTEDRRFYILFDILHSQTTFMLNRVSPRGVQIGSGFFE